jgi:putative membrane protein insertion efficiency factor
MTAAGVIQVARRVAWVAGWPVRVTLIGLIRVYRVTLSGVLGGQCRFHPSCSVYAEQAIRNRGAAMGLALAAWRVVRCSPLTRGGPDPAPGRLGVRASEPRAPQRYDGVIREAAGAAS